jgi:hypothetical protein
LDANDTPHLACKRSIYLSLYTYNGATWTFEDVAWGMDADKVIYAPGLAYAGTTPHVTFLRPNNGLYHATKEPGWTVTQVDDSPWSASHANTPLVTAATIRGGQMAVAYAWHERQTGNAIYTETIRLAYRPLTGATWITESVDSVLGDAVTQDWARPALALGATGRAHLAYYYRTDAALRHAAQTSSFTFYTVDESLELGDNAALDVGSDGSTHVAYVANGLHYAYSPADSTTWTKTLSVAGVHEAALLDLAVDGANTPHVVYQNPFAAPLYHAVLTGATWTGRAIDVPGVNANPALDADAAGTADVAYLALEGANLVVRYGRFAASAWTTATLAVAGPNQPLHWQSPNLVAQGGKVYVLYADCTAFQPSGDYPITLMLKTLAGGAWHAQTLHAFTGQCNNRLTYHLRGDSAGRLAAVAVIADAQGNAQELTFWPEDGGAGQMTTVSTRAATSNAPQGLLGYDVGRYRQVRGAGLETIYVSGGQKQAVYRDRSGAASVPVTLSSTLDSYTSLQDLACSGQTAAALEYSSNQNALAVERTVPKPPPPTTWANATKSATPNSVYAYERITYTIRLEWRGNEDAAISVKDSLFLEPVQYVPGSLSWGAYIANCQYDTGRLEISCSGAFPPSDTPLSTQVTYVVTPTCDIYMETSPYVNTALVNIGPYQFTPSARTAIKAPFRLRASTPRFVPRQDFAPAQAALLYTVPNGDEPNELLRNCQFNVYTKLKVGSASYNPQPMRNDGQNPDFHAGDWHYSQWTDLVETDPHIYDLYVTGAGQPFEKALLAHTLNIPYVSPPDGAYHLIVLTDFQAMFNEWREIGLLYTDDRRDAHIQDRNQNRILDYYDAVERIRQYAANPDHPGVVIDVARDAYRGRGTANYYGSYDDRSKMGLWVDRMVWELPRGASYLAIIGNDAVLPYRRVPIPSGAPSEILSTAEWRTVNPNIIAVQDMGAGGSRGSWLSDIPYGDNITELWGDNIIELPADGTRLISWAVGRIFSDRPLELTKLIDDLERPIVLRADSSSAWLIGDTNDEEVDFVDAMTKIFIPEFKQFYGEDKVSFVREQVALRGMPFPKGYAYWLDKNTLLKDPRNVSKPKSPRTWWGIDIEKIVKEADLLLFLTHADQNGFARVVDREALVGGVYRLAMGNACHVGVLPGARGHKAGQWGMWWPARGALGSGAPMFVPTSLYLASGYKAGVFKITVIPTQETYHHKLARRVLGNLLNHTPPTVGDALRWANMGYKCGAYCSAQDAQALYTYHLVGLPTQKIDFQAVQPAIVANLSALRRPSVLAPSAAQVISRSLVIPYFDEIRDEQGRVAFAIPHNGALNGQAFGPLWPEVQHTYLLPLDATDVTVTLTLSQSHLYSGTVDMIPLTPVAFSLGPLSGSITLTQPYPQIILDSRVYTDGHSLLLDVYLIAQQYNPETRQVTLYDRLDYRITYNAPTTYTLSNIQVNNGAPVAVDQTALPITVTVNAAQPFSGTLYWAIYDAAGTLWDVGASPLNLAAGVYQLGLGSNTMGWEPGPQQVIMALSTGSTMAEGKVVAGGHTLFTARGRSLALAMDKTVYGAGDTAAYLATTVRDETGSPVAGLAGSLTQRLDGAPLALSWQGSGVYTATLSLGSVVTGQHFISVTLGGRVAERGLIVDRDPPTSTVSGPAIVYTPTFTVTLSGEDDLSGIDTYYVQYRVGAGGAWTDWLTRTTSYDYSHAGLNDLTLTFGPTQPVALAPGQTAYFRTRAVDRAGNREAEHAAADLVVSYGAPRRYIYLPLVMRQ